MIRDLIKIKIFLYSFNKVIIHNKKLDNQNYEYFNEKYYIKRNEDIFYKLCELLITLSTTNYTMKNKDEKKDKKITVI